VYPSGTRSLAVLEMLVFAGRAAFTIPLAVFRMEIPEDWNLLLNPAHPSFVKIRIPKPQIFRF
jgi:hypothetical protein